MASRQGNGGSNAQVPITKREETNYAHCGYTYAPIDETTNNSVIDHPGITNLKLGIGPDMICHRQAGGGKVAYGEGNKIIQLANETFGFNGWSTTIRQFTVDHLDIDDRKRVDMSASAIIRITLKDGTHREDIGCGSCQNVPGKAAAFEKVRKECVTDGIKRALRQFGWLFMSAYDSNHMAEVHKKYKSVRQPIDVAQIYQGKVGIAPKKPTGSENANAPAPVQAPKPQNTVSIPLVPISRPIPAKRLPSSPPLARFDEHAPDLLKSDDFDALDEVLNARNVERRAETPPEVYNPINETNEGELLAFVAGSQAENQQKLEQIEKFNPANTPDKFSLKRSAPVRRSILNQAATNNSPLSQAQPIDSALKDAFVKPTKVMPTTPLVKKRPLQDRGVNATNTPINAVNDENSAKKQRASQD